MTGWLRSASWMGFGLTLVLCAPVAAMAQDACAPAHAKHPGTVRVKATVVRVDVIAGTVTLQDEAGRVYDFYGSPATLRTVRVGQSLEARLRQAPGC